MSSTVYQIPFVGSGTWFQQPITLEGQSVVLEFQYNERRNLWYMDIQDQAETPLVQGIPLTCGRDLLRTFNTSVFPDSVLFVYDTTGQSQDPGLNSFLLTHKLLFTTPQGAA